MKGATIRRAVAIAQQTINKSARARVGLQDFSDSSDGGDTPVCTANKTFRSCTHFSVPDRSPTLHAESPIAFFILLFLIGARFLCGVASSKPIPARQRAPSSDDVARTGSVRRNNFARIRWEPKGGGAALIGEEGASHDRKSSSPCRARPCRVCPSGLGAVDN